MKYQKKEEIKVSQFIISNNALYYCSNNGHEYSTVFSRDLTNINNQWKVDIDGIGAIMSVHDDDLFIQDSNINLFHISIKKGVYLGNLSKSDWKITLSNNLTESMYLLGIRGRLMNREYGIYDLKNDSIIFNINQSLIGLVEKDKIFTKNSVEIKCYSIELKDFIWHFSLSNLGRWYNEFDKKWEEGKVEHFVGVVNDILWVDITAHVLLGIDVHTGQIRYNLKETVPMNEFPENYPINIPYYGKTTYDSKQHKLWGMYGFLYWEVDLQNLTPYIKLWYLGDEMMKYKAFLPNLPTCGINDTHVFFGVGSIGKTPQVCALNRETLKIDWRYDFSKEAENTEIAFSPTKQEVTDNHLFVLDNKGTLHIFEREEVA